MVLEFARMVRKIQLLIGYDGSGFHGWQSQPGIRTVQGVLLTAVRRVVKEPTEVVGAGRTDTGVHAAGQVAHFETCCDIPASNLLLAIGSRLPKDMTLISAREVHGDFHATRSAVSKCYRYRVYNASVRPVGQLRDRFTYHFWHPLDEDRLRAGARHFIGQRDFSAMASKQSPRESYVRRVMRVSVFRRFHEVIIEVVGDGFLYRQVRNMVGTLLEVGRGYWEPEEVASILESLDRRNAGPTAPAKGLCLQWVRYPAELLRPAGGGQG
jgi:tRNA pseudouridine38-40 synthase